MQSHRMSAPSRKARSPLLTTPTIVISTEATDTVCCAVEKPASLPQSHPAARSFSPPVPLKRHPERSRRTPKLSTKPPSYRTFQPHIAGCPTHAVSRHERAIAQNAIPSPYPPLPLSFLPKQQTVSSSVAQWRIPLLYLNHPELNHRTTTHQPQSSNIFSHFLAQKSHVKPQNI
jgi:hypothetical protein